MTEHRKKIASEIPVALADQIDDLRSPMRLPTSTAVRHLLEIAVAAVLDQHAGSLAAAVEALNAARPATERKLSAAGKK